MPKRWWWTAAGVTALWTSGNSLAVPGAEPRAGHAIPKPADIRNRDIEFYLQRTERDPQSARDYAQLAGLYLQRARETVDNGDLLRAEGNARRSLALRTGRNRDAFGVLASTLLAQHRFSEARQVARGLVAADSSSIAARALLAETEFELGEYAAAGRMLGSLATYRENLSVAPRLARWAELHGDPEEARRLLRGARDQAGRMHAMPAEQLAWLDLRLGDLALRNGHLAEAERELRKGRSVSPNDYRILGGLARLEASRARWSSAVEYGERALASALDPATLGLVGDAYRALGDTSRAGEYYHTMEVAVLQQPGPFHRAWSLFLLDHGREVPRVLARVRREIQSRRDVYGYDLLAWALHLSGDQRQASIAMSRALVLGTRDAMLFYHAGVIALAQGDQARAADYLRQALETNPYWDPFQPARARALLASIAPQ